MIVESDVMRSDQTASGTASRTMCEARSLDWRRSPRIGRRESFAEFKGRPI
jgi:hypothetical protein